METNGSEDGYVTVLDCRYIMTRDEFRRFKMWIVDKPGRKNEKGRMEWPYKTVANFFNAIGKELLQHE